ncbi:MAG TPA: contractile injection system tape measure protein [Gemmatimonadales bacterium]|nr:contractile injection system tape measure protein [Gemmatimonadales bacterium]
MTGTHRIRHIEWRARAPSPRDGLVLRTRLRRFAETDLLPTLERAFDDVAGSETIVVPRLEISLRVRDLDELARAIAAGVHAQAGTWVRHRHDRGGGVAAGASHAPDRSETEAAIGVEGLIRYLETGLLPWPLANLDRTPTLALLEDLAARHSGAILEALPPALREARRFLFRWLQLLSESAWAELARTIESGPDDSIRGVAEAVESIANVTSLPPSARLEAVVELLAIAIVRRHGGVLHPMDRADAVATFDAGPSGSFERALGWLDRVFTQEARPAAGLKGAVVPDLADPARPAAGQPLDESSQPERVEGPRLEPFDEVAVDHAGLVLIHAFLPRLFERTAIVPAGERAIGPRVLRRAVAVLAYAARGEDSPREFELGLIKVLLGLDPGVPLLVPPGLVEADDRREVDDLLHSVIEHWQVLKHTSIAGLRTSFLQRRGLLAEVDEAWRLRIEPSGFDVLLRHLPWGISTATLPWMSKPIFTEWTAP